MKIGIVTITAGTNFGNRLQNYALQSYLEKKGFYVETLINDSKGKITIVGRIKKLVKKILHIFDIKNKKREGKFKEFNKKFIKFSKYHVSNDIQEMNNDIDNIFDFFICGSDQIWNPSFDCNAGANFLQFTTPNKRIAYSPSFGVNEIPKRRVAEIKGYLQGFKKISVREDAGKHIIEKLTKKKDIDVLIDPTMLLTSNEWSSISKQPTRLSILKEKKYILNYFLGNLSDTKQKEIIRFANENNCEIINLLDKSDPFYFSGPSEFLWLEKNAFLICTDSFHSSVFAILFNRPFVIFDRDDKNVSMSSRLENLLSKFKLNDRKYNGVNITEDYLNHDYRDAYKILEKERSKSELFINDALYVNKTEQG